MRTNSYLNPTISMKHLGSEENWNELIDELTS